MIPNFLDGFCGAGGASLGITRAGCHVRVAVNHDPRAIWAHHRNHPETFHLNTDIREVDVDWLSDAHPVNCIWWSAECTHYSNAKGGASRDADSRMLSEELFRYARALSPDWIFVENVREFFSWGPLIPKLKPGRKKSRHLSQLEARYSLVQVLLMEATAMGEIDRQQAFRDEMDALHIQIKSHGMGTYAFDGEDLVMHPDPKRRGEMYLKWVRHIEDMGYEYQYRMLNAADFGAYQSRNRYFGVFVKKSLGIPISWPKQTHAKNPKPAEGLFDVPLMKWNACKEILDLDDMGDSILYGRAGKKPLVAATLERIRYGIEKSRKSGESVMIDRSNTGASPVSANDPMPSVRASYQNGVVQVNHVDNHSFNAPPVQIDGPLPTAMANRDKYLMSAFVVPSAFSNTPYATSQPLHTQVASRKHQYLCFPFLVPKFSKPGHTSINGPTWALTTKPEYGLCQSFIVPQFGESKATSTNDPLGTITVNPKYSLNTTFLFKYYGAGHSYNGIDVPVGTCTTKDRFAVCQTLQTTYGGGNVGRRVKMLGGPVPTVTAHPNHALASCQFVAYDFNGGNGHRRISTDGEPLNTIRTCFTPKLIQARFVPRDDSEPIILELAPAHFKSRRGGWFSPTWEPWRIVNGYRVDNRILDIFYRMLKVLELKLAQGFPADYVLDPDSETVAKKHIGNAVHVKCAEEVVGVNCGPASAYARMLAETKAVGA